jgi:hypothetical protein
LTPNRDWRRRAGREAGTYDATVANVDGTQPGRWKGRAARALAIGCLTVVGLVGCGEDVATDYTSAHREGFLAACSNPLDDPRLLSDICVCVYERLESEISFTRFEAISESLTTLGDDSADPPELPEEVAEAVADCFLSEADL